MEDEMVKDKYIPLIAAHLDAHPDDTSAYKDMVSIFDDHIKRGEEEYHAQNKEFRNRIVAAAKRFGSEGKYSEIEPLNVAYRHSLFIDATYDFDAYMLYIEQEREPSKRFYWPRRKVLGPIANDLMALERGDLELLTISLPPGVGKTTLAIFYLTWLGGKHPDSPILTFSHDAGIVRGMYDEIIRIIRPGEYLWQDVFPSVPLVDTNAKDLRIDLGNRKRFETFQFSSVGAGNAGKLRAAQLLYCDDLVESIEQAMSKDRMDKLWTQYNTDIQQRKTGECKELHIATRWSVWDVIGRIERQEQDNPTGKAKFITIPALNENDESNFDYPGIHDKFTTERYHKQRDNMDDVNWKALYMNQPIEREGQLYNADELRRFFDLPEGEPDAIVAVCDTKDRGSDYAFMPVAYVYGNNWYIADCVCDNGDPGIVEERLAQCLVKNKVQLCQFESNSAGGHVAEKVQNRVKELGGNTHITTQFTTANKETKIIVNAPQVKNNCLFLDSSKYKNNSDYGKAMNMLTSYTMMGKNKHDDVCDGMSMLVLYMQNLDSGKVEVFQRPW